eukprot:Skav208243  [mRNA]  locus=scaffold2093:108435:109205:+ [translate_table: standard]
MLSGHVLVLRGSVAAQYWRIEAVGGPSPVYRQAACFGCDTFAMHGCCEHVHASWLHSGDVSLGVARMPVRPGQSSKRPALPAIIQPKHKRSRAQPSASTSRPSRCASDGLKDLLCKMGFDALWPLFVKEQLNIATLSSWDLVSMKAYFPTVPGGVAAQILRACKLRAWASAMASVSSLLATRRVSTLSGRRGGRGRGLRGASRALCSIAHALWSLRLWVQEDVVAEPMVEEARSQDDALAMLRVSLTGRGGDGARK